MRAHRPIPVLTPAQVARFHARIPDHPDVDGCLRIAGCNNGPSGYRTCSINNRNFMAHRVAYFLATGVDPGVFTVEHRCRVRACVRPSHLTLLTLKANVMADTSMSAGAVNSRKLTCPARHPYNLENTRVSIDKKGRSSRVCRVCERLRYYSKRRALGFLPRTPAVQAAKRGPLTHCVNGHPFDLANTRLDLRRDGHLHRACRSCEQARSVAKRARQREQRRNAARPSDLTSLPLGSPAPRPVLLTA